MAAPVVCLRTLEEKAVFYAISLTWLWYLLGGLYVLAPALAWLLLALLVWRWLNEEPGSPDYPRPIPPNVVIWIICMGVMQVALVIGHLNFDRSGLPMLKSSIGWMKGWALFAIFPLLGACLDIRLQVIARACALVCVQTLILVPPHGRGTADRPARHAIHLAFGDRRRTGS